MTEPMYDNEDVENGLLHDQRRKAVPQEAAPPPTKLTRQQALLAYVEWHGGCHSEECSMDDTCDCAGKPINYVINEMCRAALAVPQEARRCSATSPHVAHTFGGRPMQYCEGVTEPEKCSCECHSKGFAGCHLCFCRAPEWQEATAPDSAMRVAAEIMSVWRGNVMPFNETSIATLVREAGSARERGAVQALRRLSQHCECDCDHADDDCCAIAEPGTCATCEASRLLGGDRK